MPFFRVSFTPTISGTGVSKEGNFLEPIVKNCQNRGNFDRSGYYLVKFLCFGGYFSSNFSAVGYHLTVKVLEPGKKVPRTNLGKVPPSPRQSSYFQECFGWKEHCCSFHPLNRTNFVADRKCTVWSESLDWLHNLL